MIPGKSPERFGLIFRSMRLANKLTQAEVARILGVSPPSISRLERGSRTPTHQISFYNGLKNIPGISDDQIGKLMASKDAPRLLTGTPQDTINPTSLHVLTSSAEAQIGVSRLLLKLEIIDDSKYDQADLDDITEIVLRNAKLTLRNYFRSRTDK